MNTETSLNEKDPDYLIEEFWLGLKQSMINFYADKEIFSLSRCVKKWSDRLNYLKSQQKYKEIQHLVYNYLSLYGIDVLRSGNTYYLRLLNTNIKRWGKVCCQNDNSNYDNSNDNSSSKDISINNNSNINNNANTNKKVYQNCMLMLLDIGYKLYSKCKNDYEKQEIKCLFNDVELYLMYEDFQMLINYAIKNKKPGILDTLIKYNSSNVYEELNIILGKNVSGLSGKKILGLNK